MAISVCASANKVVVSNGGGSICVGTAIRLPASATVTVANVGAGEGEVYRDKIGTTVSLRTITGLGGVVVSTSGDLVRVDGTAVAGVPGGLDNQIQFNDGGSLGGADLYWDGQVLGFGGLAVTDPSLKGMGTSLHVRLGDNSDWGGLSVGAVDAYGDIELAAARILGWATRSEISSPADGNLLLTDDAGVDFSRIMFGGVSASFPAWRRSGTTLEAALADGSALTGLTAADLIIDGATINDLTASQIVKTNAGKTLVSAATLDHGTELSGLSDDDHSAYLLASDATDRTTFASSWLDLTDAGATTLHKHDHGGMDGLGDDDHGQYLLIDGTRAMTGQLKAIGGTTGLPGVTVGLAANSGMAQAFANNLNFSVGGDLKWSIDASERWFSSGGVVASAGGSAATPGYAFATASDFDTGMFRAGANTIGFSTGGAEAARIDSSGALILQGATDTAQLIVKANATQTITNSLLQFQSSAGTPIMEVNSNEYRNVAIGVDAGHANTTGYRNTAVGAFSLSANEATINNTAVGAYALNVATSNANTAVGVYASQENVGGASNVALGYGALQTNVDGDANTCVGMWAGQGTTETRHGNTIVGYSTGLVLTTGGSNLLLGREVGDNLTTGSRNIILGYDLEASAVGVNDELNIGGAITGDLSTGAIQFTGGLELAAAGVLSWATRSEISSPADGTILLTDDAGTDFTRLAFGSTTAADVSLLAVGSTITVTLADGSANANLTASLVAANALRAGGTGTFYWNGRTEMTAPSDGNLLLTNAAGTAFSALMLGGVSSSYPALSRNGTALQVVLADSSAFTSLYTGDVRLGAGFKLHWNSSTQLTAPSDGNLLLTDAAGTDFTKLLLGGTTSGYPGIYRDGSGISILTANAGAYSKMSAGSLQFATRSIMSGAVDGNVTLTDSAGTAFSLLQLGGVSASYPALKRASAALQSRLADDSAFADLYVNSLVLDSGDPVTWTGRSQIYSHVDGSIRLTNAATSGFDLLQLGGTTSSYPALKRDATRLEVWLADGSALTDFTANDIRANGFVQVESNARLYAAAEGNLMIADTAGTDVGLVQFGGVTSAYPAWRRSGTTMEAALADGSALTGLTAADLIIDGATINDLTASQIVKTNGSKTLVSAATLDHGTELSGLSDDDHPQYVLVTDLASNTSGSPGCSLIGIPVLNSPTWTTQCEMNSLFGSAGRATGGTITDTGGGNISVSAGTGFIKATDSDTAQLLSFDWPSDTFTPAADTETFIGVEYNSGTPQLVARTSDNWDKDTEFSVGAVIEEGGSLHILNNPWWVTDGITNLIERWEGLGHISRDEQVGGLLLSVTGTRSVAVTAGTLWSRLNEFPIPAIDTNVAGTLEVYWVNSSDVWAESDISQYSVLLWNDITLDALQNIPNNRYCNYWVYAEADDTEIAMVYPQAYHVSAAGAEAESPPSSIPHHIAEHGILIGRILFQQGVDAPVEVQSAFEQQFTASAASDHGNLTGLSDDDHTQYSLVTGTRAFTGAVTIVGSVDTEQFIVKAHSAQTNANPLLQLQASDDSPIMAISSDDITNCFVGVSAGDSNTAGVGLSNTFVGYNAGTSNTTGIRSTIVGAFAGDAELVASGTTAIGYAALSSCTALYNTAVGYTSALLVVDGLYNTALGYQSLASNISGDGNTALGFQSLYFATGADNTAAGMSAGYNNTSGGRNTAIGKQALFQNLTSSDNTAVGYKALISATGAANTAMGSEAALLVVGNYNTVMGSDAMRWSITGSDNTILGRYAGFGVEGASTYSDCVIVGTQAGQALTTGSENILLGTLAGDNLTVGATNIIIGYNLDASAADASNELNIGGVVRASLTTSTEMIAFGFAAGDAETSGTHNTAVGGYALSDMAIGNDCTAVGYLALSNTTNEDNTAMGSFSQTGAVAGSHNTSVGAYAAQRNVDGHRNTCIGRAAGSGVAGNSHSDNTFVGYGAGSAVTTGGTNTTIGTLAGNNLTTGDNNIFVGYNILASVASVDNELNIGGLITGDLALKTTATDGTLTVVGQADTEQLIVKAHSTQANTNPLLQFQASDGTPIMALHSDDATNIFLGVGAGDANTVGGGLRNIFVGNDAGGVNTTGDDNVFVGTDAGGTVNGQFRNVFMGSSAGGANNASDSVAVGYYSMAENNGGFNTCFGAYAGQADGNLGSGDFDHCVLIGNSAGVNLETGADWNTVVGTWAGFEMTTGTLNVLYGGSAGYAITTGGSNLLLGYQCGDNLTTGSRNIILGHDLDASAVGVDDELNIGGLITGDLVAKTTATDGTLTVVGQADTEQLIVKANATQSIDEPLMQFQDSAGSPIMEINVDRASNIFIGVDAGDSSTTGANNLFMGHTAGGAVTDGDGNTAVGFNALLYPTGNLNTCFGSWAGRGAVGGAASQNVFIGTQVGVDVESASQNTCVGTLPGNSLTTGNNNVLLGYRAGHDLTTGSTNIIIGHHIHASAVGASQELNIGDTLFGDLSANTLRTASHLEIDGDLDHDGSGVGFYGTAPVAKSAAYTPTNVVADRAYDANSTTVEELADVLGTLIADLQATGLIA